MDVSHCERMMPVGHTFTLSPLSFVVERGAKYEVAATCATPSMGGPEGGSDLCEVIVKRRCCIEDSGRGSLTASIRSAALQARPRRSRVMPDPQGPSSLRNVAASSHFIQIQYPSPSRYGAGDLRFSVDVRHTNLSGG
jgi:hypothetical protein